MSLRWRCIECGESGNTESEFDRLKQEYMHYGFSYDKDSELHRCRVFAHDEKPREGRIFKHWKIYYLEDGNGVGGDMWVSLEWVKMVMPRKLWKEWNVE